jgi:hypothetical protein
MMTEKTVAELVRSQMKRKSMNATTISRRTSVNRVMLWTILKGQKPPRTRTGHKTASQDPRYAELAEVLGLEVGSFVRLVEAEQTGVEKQKGAIPSYAWSNVWVEYLERQLAHSDLVQHVRYFHAVFFAACLGEVPGTAATHLPPQEIRARGICLLTAALHSSRSIPLADIRRVADKLYE